MHHYDKVDLVFMHAPPAPGDSIAGTAAGIQVVSLEGVYIVLYVTRTGHVALHEGTAARRYTAVPRSIEPGTWVSMSLEKKGQHYSVTVNGEDVWSPRPRQIEDADGKTVELWPDNVRTEIRMNTNDPAARIAVRSFAPRKARK